MPPDRLLGIFDDLAAKLPAADRVTVGMPGMIRHGRVVSTPHYVTKRGHTRVDPKLIEQWRNFDAQQAVAERLEMPAIVVLNDAEVAGAGPSPDSASRWVFTLGTGLGARSSMMAICCPISRCRARPCAAGASTTPTSATRPANGWGIWPGRDEFGNALIGLRPMFEWDRLHLGGGNGSKVEQRDLLIVGGAILVVPNSAGDRRRG